MDGGREGGRETEKEEGWREWGISELYGVYSGVYFTSRRTIGKWKKNGMDGWMVEKTDGEINEVYGVCTGVLLCLKGIKINGRETRWMDRWIDG